MTDLTIYIILGFVIPGALVLGIYLRDEITKFYEHHHHHRGPRHPA